MELITSFNKMNTIFYCINEEGDERKSQSKIVSSRCQVDSLFPVVVNNIRIIYQFEMAGILYVKGARKNIYVQRHEKEDVHYRCKSRMKKRKKSYCIKLYYPIPQIYFEHLIAFNFLYAQLTELKKINLMDIGVLNWMLVNYFSRICEKEYAQELYRKFTCEEKGYGYAEKILGKALERDDLNFEQIVAILSNYNGE